MQNHFDNHLFISEGNQHMQLYRENGVCPFSGHYRKNGKDKKDKKFIDLQACLSQCLVEKECTFVSFREGKFGNCVRYKHCPVLIQYESAIETYKKIFYKGTCYL